MPRVWKITAGRDAAFIDDFVSQNVVAIGWPLIGDLSEVHGRESIRQLLSLAYPTYTAGELSANTGQIYRFRDELTVGELVLVYDPSSRLYHTGVVSGEYVYRPDFTAEMRHTRPVRWAQTVERDSLTVQTKNSLGSISTIFCVSPAAEVEIRAILSGTKSTAAQAVELQETLHEDEAVVRKDTEESAFEFFAGSS